jgi:hypothetical protein
MQNPTIDRSIKLALLESVKLSQLDTDVTEIPRTISIVQSLKNEQCNT